MTRLTKSLAISTPEFSYIQLCERVWCIALAHTFRLIAVRFLKAGCDELVCLAEIHGLASEKILICGTQVTWESTNLLTGKKQSQDSTFYLFCT